MGSVEERARSVKATLSSFQNTQSLTTAAAMLLSSVSGGLQREGGGSCERGDFGAAAVEKMGRLAEHSDEEEEDEDDDDKVLVNPCLTAGRSDVTGNPTKTQQPPLLPPPTPTPCYDHLELVRTNSGSQTTRFSSSPSPENLSRSNTPRPSNYDQLALKEPSPPISSSERREEREGERSQQQQQSQIQSTSGSMPYARKVGIVGHTHTYDYIEVMLKGSNGGGSVVPGPEISNSARHNSDPGRSDSGTTPVQEVKKEVLLSSQWTSSNSLTLEPRGSPSTQSRRKPLPLQPASLDGSFDDGKHQQRTTAQHDKRPDRSQGKQRKPSEMMMVAAGGGELDVGKSLQSVAIRERSNSPVVPPKKTKHGRHDSPTDEATPITLAPPTTVAPPTTTPDTKPSPPPRPGRGGNLYSSHSSFDNAPSLPPPRPVDTPNFTVNLPATEFQFNKPLVPPKPRVLEHKQTAPSLSGGAHHTTTTTMRISGSEENVNYTTVYPNHHRAGPVTPRGGGSSRGNGGYPDDNTKVIYQSINFNVTEGLRKTREDVENQRSREIEWIELQREQNLMKTLAAK